MALTTAANAAEFVSIFNGKNLAGWRTVPEERGGDWSVRDGVIVGASRGQGSNLVWKDADLGDFELKLSYRFRTPGNSGIHVRANLADMRGHRIAGYHADLGDPATDAKVQGAWDYHQIRGPQRGDYLVARGQRVRIDSQGQKHFTEIDGALTAQDVHDKNWNQVHIRARGNHLVFQINEKIASEVIDEEPGKFLPKGGIGLQLHAGPAMTVEFTDIQLRRLSEDGQTGQIRPQPEKYDDEPRD